MLTEKHKRGRKHSGMIKIVLRISPEMYAAIPGNRTEYIRDATKRQMVEDELLKEGTEEVMVKIEIEVSDKNECTAEPWWVIVDPKQMMTPDPHTVMMGMITGPFFSREEAQQALDNHRQNYSSRAVVYCASGCYTYQYRKAYREAETKARLKAIK
jgi:hypothetical protein